MDPMTIAMMAMSAANSIDQAQRAKNQQAAEAAKMRFSPWTNMQGQAVAQPNSWIMEGMGGYLKGLEYEQALKDKQDRRNYLAARGNYLFNANLTDEQKKEIEMLDKAHEVEEIPKTGR